MKIAVIDLYQGTPNEGMRGIKHIIEKAPFGLTYNRFDLRNGSEIPDLNYDCYISSGGPGDPREGDGLWEDKWFDLMNGIMAHNEVPGNERKFVFQICHSFQMMCRLTGLGQISKRHSPAFGIFPIYRTEESKGDLLFSELPDPFYAVDSRSYQVTGTSEEYDGLRAPGKPFVILAVEKERPHVLFERAIMAVRFTNEIIGTQFHPEADSEGMEIYFSRPEKKAEIIKEHGELKFKNMMYSLEDPEHIARTNDLLLPRFLAGAYESFSRLEPAAK